jgi:hypothetical protein
MTRRGWQRPRHFEREGNYMSAKVKFKNGYIGAASLKVAEALEARGEVEILAIEDGQQTLDLDEKPKADKPKSRGRA